MSGPKDNRVAAIAVIWGISAGMLGLSIPLVAIAHSDLTLPLTVIVGTVISTLVIWRNPQPGPVGGELPPAQMQQIEQRIANLEVICGSEPSDSTLPPS